MRIYILKTLSFFFSWNELSTQAFSDLSPRYYVCISTREWIFVRIKSKLSILWKYYHSCTRWVVNTSISTLVTPLTLFSSSTPTRVYIYSYAYESMCSSAKAAWFRRLSASGVKWSGFLSRVWTRLLRLIWAISRALRAWDMCTSEENFF